ncbi:multicopper oxidase family protein [Dactylosporangium sucinum]|uniref:Copper oxidase n=1 Tax=Dactylosporangium sucinum TaxID=1424081 RepID=A0A917TYU1_9ACTN|nr:multicopper oxidase family protein [Dactylosporangium sucinum]GGM43058.1 copper oxidase [Dactylosporangium sucinum]
MRRTHLRAAVSVTAALAVLSPLGWWWQDSLVPDAYSIMDMGYADYGGGVSHEGMHHGGTAVTALTGPRDRPADVSVTLVARAERIQLPDGRSVAGYTLNHASPGPEIRAEQGQLVEVRLVNESVPDGVTLHWHGYDVPNAEDGVAGVTQDAVAVGGEHVYRFVAADAGTYWYHSHQVSHEQVRLGLFGALVVSPPGGTRAGVDRLALVHTYAGRRTIAGRPGETRVSAAAGGTVRVRLVNTDQGTLRAWVSGAPYRVVAVDGHEVTAPPPVTAAAIVLAAGARADLELVVPQGSGAVRVDVGAGTALVFGPDGATAPADPEPRTAVDLLSYGAPAPLGFDPSAATRRFEYRIGRRPGFLDGRPGLWWTINGHLYPDVPMFMVGPGDVVRMSIANDSGETHPMHLHGHHAVVLSRNGTAATGSPWWTDSLEVADGERYEIAFVADNPGVWVDHCHNLDHAAEGLLAHLSYVGVTTPYRIGDHRNHPE